MRTPVVLSHEVRGGLDLAAFTLAPCAWSAILFPDDICLACGIGRGGGLIVVASAEVGKQSICPMVKADDDDEVNDGLFDEDDPIVLLMAIDLMDPSDG